MYVNKYGSLFLETELILAATADDEEYIRKYLHDSDNFPTIESLHAIARAVARLDELVYQETENRKHEYAERSLNNG